MIMHNNLLNWIFGRTANPKADGLLLKVLDQSILNEHILQTCNIVPVGASPDGYCTIDFSAPHRSWQSANMSC
jgi:hypothetical protein